MTMEILASLLDNYVPTGVIGGVLLGAGMCFTLVYVAALATILACHLQEP